MNTNTAVGMKIIDGVREFFYIENDMDWQYADTVFLNADGSNHTGAGASEKDKEEYLEWLA